MDSGARLANHAKVSKEVKLAATGELGNDGAGFADFKRCFQSILRGSLIGVSIGAIPGIGGAPAAFLSYSEAKRTSKHPERFSKVELEGVAVADAGNNGVQGETMITLLAHWVYQMMSSQW